MCLTLTPEFPLPQANLRTVQDEHCKGRQEARTCRALMIADLPLPFAPLMNVMWGLHPTRTTFMLQYTHNIFVIVQ